MVEAGPASTQPPKDLIGFLDYYLVTKAPIQIPEQGKEWLVKYGPWIVVVFAVLSLPLLFALLGLSALVAPFTGGVGYATGFGILALGGLVELVLMLMALPGLFGRKMSGWNLLFYANLVGIASRLLAGAIVAAVLGGLISLYILFQVRPLYKA